MSTDQYPVTIYLRQRAEPLRLRLHGEDYHQFLSDVATLRNTDVQTVKGYDPDVGTYQLHGSYSDSAMCVVRWSDVQLVILGE
jgi:hypothetical protein